MEPVSFEHCCDFHCWVIKYNRKSPFPVIYQKDSLNDSGYMVPLLYEHDHSSPDAVLGCATLEYRDEGVYAYCKFFCKPEIDIVRLWLEDRGTVSLSPYINNVIREGKNVTHGIIREISLVRDRIDYDESYFPIICKGESK